MNGLAGYDYPQNTQAAPMQGYADAAARMPSDWERIAGNLDQMLAHAEQMTAEMTKIANHLFGPPPSMDIEQAKERPNGIGALDELHARHDNLRAQLACLWQQCERFRRLA